MLKLVQKMANLNDKIEISHCTESAHMNGKI